MAGLILTDRRLVYKKYASQREYDLLKQGSVQIDADKTTAMIEISQEGQRSAVLSSSPQHAMANYNKSLAHAENFQFAEREDARARAEGRERALGLRGSLAPAR